MSLGKKIIWMTVGLAVLGMIYKGSDFYIAALNGVTRTFNKFFGALASGGR